VWLFSALTVTLYGIYQIIREPGGAVISSFFTLNSYLAQYLVLIMPVILALLLFKKTKKEGSRPVDGMGRIFLGIILLLTWFLLGLTMERGPWLGIIVGLLMMGIVLRDKRILIGIPLLLMLSFFISPPSIRIRAISIFQPRWSLERLYCWRSCLSMTKDHPFFGVGLGNFRYVYPKYMLGAAKVKFLHAHNIFFQIATEMGIPGLLVFLWLLFNFFKATLSHIQKDKYLRALNVGFSAGIIAILVTSLFHDIFHSRQIATLTWYIIGMAIASHKLKDQETPGD
ncbi:MAG: O-antigen ligase family protein, partial [Candidatus Omnitrophica bacterium]|nr:O-antigen ligase family protein [Candidatus Omnitrophota bacterium]